MSKSKCNKEESFVATIGFFDGVHKGHQYVIEQLKHITKQKKEKSLVITFDIHPRKVLRADYQPQLLTTLSEKIFWLKSLQVDNCVVLNFTVETAQLSAFEFMKDILKKQYNISTLLIGYDHRFGHNRSETFQDYVRYGQQLNIDVIQIERFASSIYDNISSSEIRRALLQGDIQMANQMLGYSYLLEGKVIDGCKIGRKIGFPTANLQITSEDKIIPKTGVYVVNVMIDDSLYYGILNIGIRPTLQNEERTSIEVHIINFNKDIYNQIIQIHFLEHIRNEEKFENVEELISQLNKDRDYSIKKYLEKQTL